MSYTGALMGDAPGWNDSLSSPTIAYSKNAGGPLPIIWAARDDDGLFTQRDTFTITFNRPPVVPSILTPGDTASWYSIDSSNARGSVIFKWNSSDPDGVEDLVK